MKGPERRIGGLTFVGMTTALATGLMTNALARTGAPLWLLFSLAIAGVFSSGYFAGRRDEARRDLKERR